MARAFPDGLRFGDVISWQWWLETGRDAAYQENMVTPVFDDVDDSKIWLVQRRAWLFLRD